MPRKQSPPVGAPVDCAIGVGCAAWTVGVTTHSAAHRASPVASLRMRFADVRWSARAPTTSAARRLPGAHHRASPARGTEVDQPRVDASAPDHDPTSEPGRALGHGARPSEQRCRWRPRRPRARVVRQGPALGLRQGRSLAARAAYLRREPSRGVMRPPLLKQGSARPGRPCPWPCPGAAHRPSQSGRGDGAYKQPAGRSARRTSPARNRPSGPALPTPAFGTGAMYSRRCSTPQTASGEHGSQATGATARRPAAPSSVPRSATYWKASPTVR